MKIKFSKVVAIGCAICVAFAGLTAFAATVTTTTTYGYEDGVEDMTVSTTVTGVAANKEVTYYVSDKDGIVYINQDTATDGTVTFNFSTTEARFIQATAKYGTDDAETKNLPTFEFAQGTNVISNGDVSATPVEGAWGVEPPAEVTGLSENAVAYKAKVSGNYTEYGIIADGVKYPAVGCDEDGVYMVILEGITPASVEPYAVAWTATPAN